MGAVSYEESVKGVWKGFFILLGATLLEVAVAIFWKSDIGLGNPDVGIWGWWFPLFMMAVSAFKAYFIVKEFMHLGHEVRGMALSILLPLFLLVWAIIAFLWEGDRWKYRRDLIEEDKVGKEDVGYINLIDDSTESYKLI